jgi:hypothetical protein
MSKEDRKWMEDALKQYTFNDADRLQQICKDLPDKTRTDDDFINLLTELQELVELHPRNNLNLCLSGGMIEIISLIFSHPNP